MISLPEFFKEQHSMNFSSHIDGARSAPMTPGHSTSASSIGKAKGKATVGGFGISSQLQKMKRHSASSRNRSNSAPPSNLMWLKTSLVGASTSTLVNGAVVLPKSDGNVMDPLLDGEDEQGDAGQTLGMSSPLYS